MSSSFDKSPSLIDKRQPESWFELPPRQLRKKFPFIKHDPAFPQDVLPLPEPIHELANTGFSNLEVNDDAPEIALRLVLHFGMRDAKKRAYFFNLLKQEPPLDEEKRALILLARQGVLNLPDLAKNYPPDHKPAWRRLCTIQPLSGIKIIDYGAASGGFVRLLRALGANAIGIDEVDDYAKEHLVLGRDSLLNEDSKLFEGTDLFVSNRLMRTVNVAPQHRQEMDVVTARLLKPGGLVMTVPSLMQSDERLDDAAHYGASYSQFDYTGEDENWSYTVARKN